MSNPLSPEEAARLLATKRQPRGVATEPRDINTWYKLDHMLRPDGCTNPDCVDDRPLGDRGRNIVFKMGNEFICRECFLAGWLSNDSE
jgi:hypothetical protein